MKSVIIYASDDALGRKCEWQCQLMLEAGLKFLADHPGYDLANDPAELNAAMRDARKAAGDTHSISGGQYNVVINHLRVIRDNSYAWWFGEVAKVREPWEIFEFNGSLESVPQGE